MRSQGRSVGPNAISDRPRMTREVRRETHNGDHHCLYIGLSEEIKRVQEVRKAGEYMLSCRNVGEERGCGFHGRRALCMSPVQRYGILPPTRADTYSRGHGRYGAIAGRAVIASLLIPSTALFVARNAHGKRRASCIHLRKRHIGFPRI